MTFIYSFLQKRKMHESHHGIIMVVTAYVLSVLMLALGSDVFYNINSEAAGISAKTEEETQEAIIWDTSVQSVDDYSLKTQSKLLNPYNLDNTIEDIDLSTPVTEDTSAEADTVWFLGNAMDNEAFDSMMSKIGSYVGKAEFGQAAVSDKKENKGTIKSLSAKTTAGNTVTNVTQEEVAMLERIVEAEAEGEDMVGKILIANVIFNRILAEEFPDSVEDVIFQKDHGDYQFSPVKSGRYWKVDISKDTKEAVQKALEGEDYSKGALYFFARRQTTSESAKWFDKNLKWLFKHGGHEFYKNK